MEGVGALKTPFMTNGGQQQLELVVVVDVGESRNEQMGDYSLPYDWPH